MDELRKYQSQPQSRSAHTNEAQPLVSICIAAYNAERVMGATLHSILSQTYANIEVIVLDNGSTDGTGEVIRSVADERLRRLEAMPGLGGYQGMNKAISVARGALVAVYHHDDLYEPTIVEKEVAYLQALPHVGAVFCLDHYMDDHGHIFGGTTMPAVFRGRAALDYDDVFRFILRHKNVLLRCPTFMTRRAVLETVGPFEPERFMSGADVEMWLRIVRRFPIAILNERLIRYRVGTANWSARYRRLRTEPEHFFAVMDHYLAADGWLSKLNQGDLDEYAFHRCDDETFRAANSIILGDGAGARALLQQRYPWRIFLRHPRRRKWRALLLGMCMRVGLRVGAVGMLARLLHWTEYRGQGSRW